VNRMTSIGILAAALAAVVVAGCSNPATPTAPGTAAPTTAAAPAWATAAAPRLACRECPG
jgi:hypothetical protein